MAEKVKVFLNKIIKKSWKMLIKYLFLINYLIYNAAYLFPNFLLNLSTWPLDSVDLSLPE